MDKNIQTALRLRNSEKGFALVAAIMACLILLALGMLVIALSTQDIRVSVKIVGDKRALAAAEEGIHSLCQTFDPINHPVNAPVTTPRADGKSSYTINYPATRPLKGPDSIPVPHGGSQIAGSTVWELKRYKIDVVGKSTEYNTQVTIGLGVQYGPVNPSTMQQ